MGFHVMREYTDISMNKISFKSCKVLYTCFIYMYNGKKTHHIFN